MKNYLKVFFHCLFYLHRQCKFSIIDKRHKEVWHVCECGFNKDSMPFRYQVHFGLEEDKNE